MTILGAISGVITPLGLGEKLVTTGTQVGTFEYTRDTSSIAIGTSLRGNSTFHRTCEDSRVYFLPRPCPYTGDVMETTRYENGSVRRDYAYGIHRAIPNVLREIFSSGTAGQASTISNIFDIEWRQTSKKEANENFDNGTVYETGIYRQLDSILLQDGYKTFEGLVVDNNVGGIGFRNHTLPIGFSRGATWQEDLLFIEPDVSCINTNLSIDFEASNTGTVDGFLNRVITDKGGFVDLNITHLPASRPKSQSNLDLQARAYDAAVLNNAYTMMILNITDRNNKSNNRMPYSYLKSKRGATFPIKENSMSYSSLELSNKFGSYFYPAGLNLTHYPNPFNITNSDLGAISNICAGVDVSKNRANISNIYTTCGLLRGAPVRVDGGSGVIFERGSKWSSTLHSCAATARATIKTVSFALNATTSGHGLDGLTVTAIEPKKYADENEVPLWGFEETGSIFEELTPLWGLISPKYESHTNISSVRQPSFYIPGRHRSGHLGQAFSDNLPSSLFATAVMDKVFELDDKWHFDLQGSASTSVFRRWQLLSQDAVTATTIIKLMWTDLATSAVVGTKGTLGHLNQRKGEEVVQVLVTPIKRGITYNIPYGIPAFLLLLCLATISIASLLSTCLQSANIGRIRLRLHQVSVGRVYTTQLYPEDSSLSMPSKEWSQRYGSRQLRLTNICEEDELTESERQHNISGEKEPDQTIKQPINSHQS